MNTRDLEAALSRVERRYRQIAREISPLDLHRSEDSEASLGDLTDLQLGLGHRGESRSALFVGYYTEEGLRDALSSALHERRDPAGRVGQHARLGGQARSLRRTQRRLRDGLDLDP